MMAYLFLLGAIIAEVSATLSLRMAATGVRAYYAAVEGLQRAYDVMREIPREARQFTPREFRIVAAPQVIELLLDEESQHLAGLSDFIGKPISLRAETVSSPEQYDIVLL